MVYNGALNEYRPIGKGRAMLTNYYADALKQGQKEFRRCTAEGIHPYPTALESILPEGERISGTDMGVIQIPMEHVAADAEKDIPLMTMQCVISR